MPAHNPLEVFLRAAVLRSTPSENRPALIESVVTLGLPATRYLSADPSACTPSPPVAPVSWAIAEFLSPGIPFSIRWFKCTILAWEPVAWAPGLQEIERSRRGTSRCVRRSDRVMATSDQLWSPPNVGPNRALHEAWQHDPTFLPEARLK
jgi:hypothetical protein